MYTTRLNIINMPDNSQLNIKFFSLLFSVFAHEIQIPRGITGRYGPATYFSGKILNC